MAAIKAALDPAGLLNPGKVLRPRGDCAIVGRPEPPPEPHEGHEPMKITDVETILINPKLAARNAGQKPRFSGIDTQTVYKVVLDNGVVGWGDTRGHAAMSDDGKAALVGTNPVLHLSADHPTGLHGALYGRRRQEPGGARLGAHGAQAPGPRPRRRLDPPRRSRRTWPPRCSARWTRATCTSRSTPATTTASSSRPGPWRTWRPPASRCTTTSTTTAPRPRSCASSTRSRSPGSWGCWRTPSSGATSTAGGGCGRRPPCPCSCTCPPSAPAPRSSTAAPTST